MSVPSIESRLREARERLQRAADALGPKLRGGEIEAWRDAMQGVLGLERELAAEKGEEHAVPLDFPVRWVIGAPLPHLLCNDTKSRLIFYVAEGFSGESGARIEIVDPRSKAPVLLALVEFQAAAASRLGDPNDEVFHGHPLAGRGQEPYCAQEVLNSKWAAEIQAVNSVHAR